MSSVAAPRPRLFLFFAAADHPHRDAACSTLAWLAEGEGARFECYYDSARSGIHYGGGHPGHAAVADLRGGTFTGGHHLEQFYLLLRMFDCEAACLGPSSFDAQLAECQVPVRSRSGHIATFYQEVFASGRTAWPERLLVVGDGGKPQGVSLGAYAFPEVVGRRMLAIADGDGGALAELGRDLQVERLWTAADHPGGVLIESPPIPSIAAQTSWMAERWREGSRGFLLGDPELVARWTPTAVREAWLPLFGIPQATLIADHADWLSRDAVVYGRQQDDRDFMELSRAGVAFQLIDPGRPPFPVIKEGGMRPAAIVPADDPDDAQLERWAAEGRVLSSLLFWTGMVRELENLYAVADLLSLSGLAAGLVLTTPSFEYMPHPPLTLPYVPSDLGGLAPKVEILLASGGLGAFIESATPPERFAAALEAGVKQLSDQLGSRELVPRGWWGTMDAPLLQLARPPRITRQPDPPFAQIRFRSRGGGGGGGGEFTPVPAVVPASRPSLRGAIRATPARHLFEALRPFDGYRPGPPGRAVLEAVRDAGFEYAFTKSSFGRAPAVVSGITGLTTLNYTVGRWDGWTPFATVNTLADLEQAERRLLRQGRPGWLVGTLDTCLWTFTGPIWQRAGKLRAICDWMAGGGASGRLVNTTPRTVARYARLLALSGRVDAIPAA